MKSRFYLFLIFSEKVPFLVLWFFFSLPAYLRFLELSLFSH